LKLPRDLSGRDLAKLLSRLGYEFVRQDGSHRRYVSRAKGREHRLTIPDHDVLKVGLLSEILRDVAAYLEMSRDDLIRKLFG
jgi:predicted RNA binding protein YcfA (HicA-like mRNA interferase family)